MKSRKIIIIAPIVLLLLIVVNIVVLAELHPFRPGDALFGLQSAVENTQLKLISHPQNRIEFGFDLVERRLADLEMVDQQVQVQLAVDAFDLALTRAILNIQKLDDVNAEVYYHNVQPLMRRVEKVVANLEIKLANAHLTSLRHKVTTLKTTKSPIELINLVTEQYLSKILLIQEVAHHTTEFVVVENKSTTQQPMASDNKNCIDCHADGEYMDKASECSKCHLRAVYFASKLETEYYRPKYLEEDYPYHFGGDCIDCHKTKSWEPFQFDHRNVYTCVSCHEEDTPREVLQASADQIFFTSLTKKDSDTKQSPHYPGECTLCHNTSSWSDVNFNHTGYTNCSSCHTRPPKHPGVQCSQCHTTDTWDIP